jgi:hypothetical protein
LTGLASQPIVASVQPLKEALMVQEFEGQDRDSVLFFSLVISLSQSAMSALGKIINPVTGKAEVDLPAASHTIDLLEMLEKKTEGNTTEKEQTLLKTVLTNLRLNYVEMMKDQKKREAGEQASQSE